MKTAIILPVAFYSTLLSAPNREDRISQYVEGFNQVADLVKQYPHDFDVFVVDSTIEPTSMIDQRLKDAIKKIPNLKESCFFYDNNLGKKNKGVGLIVQWKRILSFIGEEYEYCISFEPRQKLVNFNFFEDFLKKPNNYFLVVRSIEKKYKIFPYALVQFCTGFMAVKRNDLERYVKQTCLFWMTLRRISIERDLYDFFMRVGISYIKLNKLNIIWHDSATNTDVML